jgi:hypothetical protein
VNTANQQASVFGSLAGDEIPFLMIVLRRSEISNEQKTDVSRYLKSMPDPAIRPTEDAPF